MYIDRCNDIDRSVDISIVDIYIARYTDRNIDRAKMIDDRYSDRSTSYDISIDRSIVRPIYRAISIDDRYIDRYRLIDIAIR